MEATGERYIPEQMKGQIEAEHWCRYHFVHNIFNLQGKRVLDIASGAGYGSHLLAHYAEKVYGVDISKEAVAYAHSHFQKENLEYRQGDCCHIPLPDESVDMVVSFETIEHHDQHEAFLQEISRVLTADGVLVMSSPDKKQYTDIPNYHNPYHVKELYAEEFYTLIERHFSHSIRYSQALIIGSLIYPQGKITQQPFISFAGNNSSESNVLYNLVIASNISLKLPTPVLLYSDTAMVAFPKGEMEDRVHDAFQRGVAYNRQSLSWRIGNILLTPLKLLRRKRK